MDINRQLAKQIYCLGIREFHKPSQSVEQFKSTKTKQQFPELPSCEADRRPTLLSHFSTAQHLKQFSPHIPIPDTIQWALLVQDAILLGNRSGLGSFIHSSPKSSCFQKLLWHQPLPTPFQLRMMHWPQGLWTETPTHYFRNYVALGKLHPFPQKLCLPHKSWG